MPQFLPSATDTRANEQRILKAARQLFRRRTGLAAFFEHGLWWLKLDDGEDTRWYDVVDATGPDTAEGFGFEQV